MENASKLKIRRTFYDTLPCRPGSFHNQGEAETLVLDGRRTGSAEHGGMSFLKEAIISPGANIYVSTYTGSFFCLG
jgi:hypothetical protein